MNSLLRPASVAVVGVSEDPRKLGSRVLKNLVGAGFAGRIYGVGRCQEAHGVACYPDAAALPEAVDVAFLAVPAGATVTAAEQCAARGVRALVVGAAGFAEDGDEEGIVRQAALTCIARDNDIRLLGPNCNGLYNTHHDLSLGFNTAHGEKLPKGDIAVLSHSGALFESMVRRVEALGGGFSTFVSLGNEAGLNVLDLMEDQIAAPETRVIALLIDALPDGERFARLAARALTENKPVVVLKLGRSPVGAAAASAHSSRLVGDDEAYAALFRRCGVAVTSTLEGFTTAAVLLARFGARPGGVAAISTSGAGGALLADIAARHHAPLPAYAPVTNERLGEYRRFSALANPTDLGVFAGAVGHSVIISAIVDDPGVSALIFQTHAIEQNTRRVIAALAASQTATGKAHVLLAPGGLPESDVAEARAQGVVLLTDSDAAVQALGALVTATPTPDQEASSRIPAPGRTTLSEKESLVLLERYGVQTTSSAVCAGLEDALVEAAAFGWPVVLKSAEEGLAHKSDQGLVRVGLRDATELSAAFEEMGRPTKVLVQPMIKGDLEIIVGVARSPGTGLTMLAGLGGVFAEALDQTTKWSLPTSRAQIEAQLAESPLGRVLASSRWGIAGTSAQLVDTLLTLQRIALGASDWIEAIDVNPIIATPKGLIAVDGLIIARET